MERLVVESCYMKEKFLRSLQCEQKEAAVQLPWLKVIAILPTGFEENRIYQRYTTAKANVQMLK